MDFFEAQARAKRRTTRLVFLFVLAVLGTILASYAAVLLLLAYGSPGGLAPGAWWNPSLFAGTAGFVLVIAGGGSLFKWLSFRAGGSAVAESLGARRVEPGRATPDERRLLNVVEEMAIASGVPIPAVYVLDDEPALNAFAAGLTPGDAVVAVTRGTMEKLSRDELQGVVAHEFSHILNGDMRLNVKLSAIVFGILVLGLMGRGILRSLGRGRVRVGGSGKNKGGGIAVILAIGLALMIIGYIGYFFGRLIQAAVSRQREYLADAAAVQFTRNPAGIAGALKKIGGYALGSTMLTPKAAEIGHFFFAQGFRSHLGGLWATHPPLDERIRAIEPTWDGQLHEPETVVDINRETFATAGFQGAARPAAEEAVRQAYAAPARIPPPLPSARIPFHPTTVVADIGALTDRHFARAQTLLEQLPAGLREAAADASRAPAVVYGLLLGTKAPDRSAANDIVARQDGEASAASVRDLRPALSLLDPAARLPLLLLAAPTLRTLPRPALERFLATLDELVHADGQVDAFEFVLQKVLTRQLALGGPARVVQYDSFVAVTPDVSVVLSVLARAGNDAAPAIAAAFLQGAAQLPLIAPSLALRPPAETGFAELDRALDRLAASSLPIRRRLLTAAAHVIGQDGTVTVAEGELYRAIALAVDCPAPLLAA